MHGKPDLQNILWLNPFRLERAKNNLLLLFIAPQKAKKSDFVLSFINTPLLVKDIVNHLVDNLL